MIEYRAYNVDGEKPQLQKVIVFGDEEYATNLVPENHDELHEVNYGLVEEHMNNLLNYSKEVANSMRFYPTMEEAGSQQYPVENMMELLKVTDETCRWWAHLYHIDEHNGAELVGTSEEHESLHEADTPHIHHPDTGEIIYTDTAEPHTHDEVTGDVVSVSEEETDTGGTE